MPKVDSAASAGQEVTTHLFLALNLVLNNSRLHYPWNPKKNIFQLLTNLRGVFFLDFIENSFVQSSMLWKNCYSRCLFYLLFDLFFVCFLCLRASPGNLSSKRFSEMSWSTLDPLFYLICCFLCLFILFVCLFYEQHLGIWAQTSFPQCRGTHSTHRWQHPSPGEISSDLYCT